MAFTRSLLLVMLVFGFAISQPAEASWLSKTFNKAVKSVKNEVRKVTKKIEKLEDKLEKVGKDIAKAATSKLAKDAVYTALMAAGLGPYPLLIELTVNIAGAQVKDLWRCREDFKCMRNSLAKNAKDAVKQATKKVLTQIAPEVVHAYELGKAIAKASN